MVLFFVRRGIPAQPILNGYCGSYELGMPRSMINHPAFNHEESTWIDVIIPPAKPISTRSSLSDTAMSVTASISASVLLIITITLLDFLFQY